MAKNRTRRLVTDQAINDHTGMIRRRVPLTTVIQTAHRTRKTTTMGQRERNPMAAAVAAAVAVAVAVVAVVAVVAAVAVVPIVATKAATVVVTRVVAAAVLQRARARAVPVVATANQESRRKQTEEKRRVHLRPKEDLKSVRLCRPISTAPVQ